MGNKDSSESRFNLEGEFSLRSKENQLKKTCIRERYYWSSTLERSRFAFYSEGMERLSIMFQSLENPIDNSINVGESIICELLYTD